MIIIIIYYIIDYLNVHQMCESGLLTSFANSLYDFRRQSDLPSSKEPRDFMQDGERRPSLFSASVFMEFKVIS